MLRAFLLLAVSSLVSATYTKTDPVCIVGAGPSGLVTANKLQAKGYQTVIFDKREQVGGKCQAYYDNGGLTFHPLGALLFSNETYANTLPIVDASGVPSLPFAYISQYYEFDPHNGTVDQAPLSVHDLTSSIPQFQEELGRYINYWNTTFRPYATVGYKNGVGNYTMSTYDWLMENDYPLLTALFIGGMVPYGYGRILEVPALYMLQYFTPDILLFFSGQGVGYITDFHQVFVDYAQSSVKGPIYTNTSVTKIDRSGSYPVVTYETSGSSAKQQTCSKVILAFPPIRRALDDACIDLDKQEQAVFDPVGVNSYWSGAISMITPYATFSGYLPSSSVATLVGWVIQNVSTPEISDRFKSYVPQLDGRPSAFLPIFDQSNVVTLWSMGEFNSNQTTENARFLLKDTLSKFNKVNPLDASEVPTPVTDADIHAFEGWDYFPRYDGEALANGAYEKFNALQGHKDTYYVSGLNGFETVEFAIRAAQDLVSSHF